MIPILVSLSLQRFFFLSLSRSPQIRKAHGDEFYFRPEEQHSDFFLMFLVKKVLTYHVSAFCPWHRHPPLIIGYCRCLIVNLSSPLMKIQNACLTRSPKLMTYMTGNAVLGVTHLGQIAKLIILEIAVLWSMTNIPSQAHLHHYFLIEMPFFL